MNETKGIFKLSKKQKEMMNAKLIISLFETLYRNNYITKKEFDILALNLHRTFNIDSKLL